MPTDKERYLAAAHAMQSGVAAEMQINPKGTEPKHLRVGVNAAMVEHGALVGLLIAKGLFTLAEFEAALADGMEAEVARFEETLSAHYGKPVTLA